MPTLLELEVYQFVCDFILFMMRAEDYLRPLELIGFKSTEQKLVQAIVDVCTFILQ